MPPDILLSIVALAAALFMMHSSWHGRHAAGVNPVLLPLFSVLWLIAYLGQLPYVTDDTRQWWLIAQYAIAVFIPICWHLFTPLLYSRQNWLTKSRFAVLPAAASLLSLAIVTNSLHHWFVESVSGGETAPFLNIQFGQLLAVFHIYFVGVLLLSMFCIVANWRADARANRRMSIMVLVSLTVLLLGALLSSFAPLWDSPSRTLTLGMSLSTLLTAWGTARFHFYEHEQFEHNSLLHSVDHPIIILDTSERIIDSNAAAQKTFACQAASILGQPITSVLPKLGEVGLSSHDTTSTRYEILLTTDGRDRWFDLTVSPIRDNNQRLRGHLFLFHDTTSSRQLKESLIDEKNAAENALRMRSEFVATITHEIRTPLHALISMTELLQETKLNRQQRDYVEPLRACGEMLIDLVNSVLDFAKIESDNAEIETKPLAIAQCIEQTLDLFAAQAAHKGVELVYYVSESTPSLIRSDVIRLRQILINLVGNAMKFTHQGEISVKISSQPVDDAFRIHFRVQDTGIGVPEDKLHRLFQSFSQVNTSTAQEYGGSGLGLVISRGLVERMGGTIWVDSKANVGSTFHFTIMAAAAPQSSTTTTDSNLAGKTALIIDPNAQRCSMIVQTLASQQMATRSFKEYGAAIEFLRQNPDIDVLLFDHALPGQPAHELINIVKNDVGLEDLPTIVFVPVGEPSIYNQINQLPHVIGMTKPLKYTQLVQTLTQIWKESQSTSTHMGDTAVSRTPGQNGTATIAATVSAGSGAVDRNQPGNPISILVGEDNQLGRKVMLSLLRRMGYDADVVSDGLQILSALGQKRYDVILMDLYMPNLSGIEAVKQIRKRSYVWPQPYIIAVTGSTSSNDRERSLAAGIDDYVTKPIRVETLAQALERARQTVNQNRSDN